MRDHQDIRLMNKPSVSVIIPTYNRASLLARSVNSILGQTYQDFEIIIVDDASTDNTEKLVKTLKDPRIIYLKHEKNRGGSAARNTGIKAARADLIAFQDSDDEWLPDKLAKQMDLLAEAPPEAGVVYTGFWRTNGDKKECIPGPAIKTTQGNIHQELLTENFVTTQAVLVKKECFQKAGTFDETLPRFQDWELFLRISKYFEFLYVPEPLVISYFTEGSISSKPKALIEALEIIFAKNLTEYKNNPRIYADHLIRLSNLYRYTNDLKNCRRCLIEAARTCFSPGLIVAVGASFLGKTFYEFYWGLIDKNRTGNPDKQFPAP